MSSSLDSIKKRLRRHSQQRIPLQLVLVLPFLLQLLGAVGLVGYLSWRNGQQAIYDLTSRLIGEVSDRIESELSDHVGQATRVNHMNAEAIAEGMLDLQDPTRLNRYFLEQIQTYDGLTAIYWSTETGAYVGVEHRPDGMYALGLADSTTNGNLAIYGVDDQNQPTGLLNSAPYDPRQRPWYQLAVTQGDSTWTSIFVWAPLINMSIDTVQPIYDEGQLQGVLGVSLGLLDISHFLRQLDLGTSGAAYIIEPATETLVATSTKQAPYQTSEDGKTAHRLPIETPELPLLQASAKFLKDCFDDLDQVSHSQQLDFRIAGDRYFLRVTPLHETIGLDWMLVVVVPESDFMAQINANARITLILCGGALMLAIGVGMLTTRWVTRPITQLNQAAKQLTHRDWHSQSNASTRIQEVEELAASFQLMATELQDVFTLLERKVDERTAALADTNRQLEMAKDKAEIANQTKSRFIANMSHELRTPMNAILGFTQLLLRDTGLSSQQQKAVTVINSSGEHLLDLINNVLEVSKFESGTLTLSLKRFDVRSLLQTLKTIFQLQADTKQLSLDFVIDDAIPRYISGDESKLRQVLMNLLGNAIKFTQVGHVRLTATFGSPDTKNPHGTLQFSIADTGPGIPNSRLPVLFRPFAQTPHQGPGEGGSGLGLAIAQYFVQLMGSTIEVSTQVGEGSTFRFTMTLHPINATEVSPFSDQTIHRLMPNQPEYRILVVDDRPENRDPLVQLLKSVGFDTHVANNGRDALAQWLTWQPHLIWMDLRMPLMDGYEATRRIRAIEESGMQPGDEANHSSWKPGCNVDEPLNMANTPLSTSVRGLHSYTKIIALTASTGNDRQDEILAAGCDDYVHKPFHAAEIFRKMADHLGVQYQRMSPHVTPSPPELPVEQLLPEVLRRMPSNWSAELHQAAIQADADWLRSLVAHIPADQEILGRYLNHLITQLDFETLINLTETSPGD